MKKNLKILFVIRSMRPFHYHQSTVSALCKRGYRVQMLFDYEWSKTKIGALEIVEKFKQETKNFNYKWAYGRNDIWSKILFPAREILSYRRYLINKEQSEYYKDRWRKYIPRWLRFFSNKLTLVDFVLKMKWTDDLLRFIERIVPPDVKVINDIKDYQPDIVVVSPTNLRRSSADLEYLKAAKSLGIPTALQVLSWDNLTTKGLIHIVPDIVLAWNDVQAKEAEVFHKTPPNIIRITGAPVFDGWFTRLKPSCTRAEFCSRFGLKEGRPFIVHLGSSANIAKNEIWLVKELQSALRASNDHRVNTIQIVFRSHPGNFITSNNLNEDDIIFVPAEGSAKILLNTKENLQLFYDTLYYSLGAVSINTSGMIDAIIADKPVIAIMSDYYRATQSETLHFQHLLQNDVVEIAKTKDEFKTVVKRLLDGKDERKNKRRIFVEKFIRPHGLEQSAGERAADEIEELINIVK